MIKKKIVVSFAAAIILAVISKPVFANVAVGLTGGQYAWPGAGTNHGWQFTVNEPIIVTHLGLFDEWPDGFEIDHPIGLWRLSDSELLASGTVSAGTGDPLLDEFRYIDVPDVALDVDVDYVIGFYSELAMADKNITKAEDLEVNPAISIVAARWDVAGQSQMPANIVENPDYPDRFGPNFQFIPEPGTAFLLGLGAMLLRRRRA